MRTFFQFITLLFFGLTLQAQEAKKAKDLLDEVYTKAKSYDNIVIDFRFTLQNTKQNQDQDSKGNVTLKGNLFVLNFMGVTKMFDGKKNYTIIPEDEEITVSKYDENDENSITPSKILTFFNSGYKYAWDKLLNIRGDRKSVV